MSALSQYLTEIEKARNAGNATEHTHRPALIGLLKKINARVSITNEPKLEKYGRPDLVIADGISLISAIETKDIGDDLDKTEKGEQLTRYFGYISNLVLTDYLEFRWYKDGELKDSARIATIDKANKLKRDAEGEEKLLKMLGFFLESKGELISSPKDLAAKMAKVAAQIRVAIEEALKNEDLTDNKPDPLHDQLNSFKKTLLPNITEEEFADLYAQTVAYGFFSARVNKNTGTFTRKGIAEELPRTNPFMRNLAEQMMGVNMPESISWAADYLAELLNRVDLSAVLKNFGRTAQRQDAVVYFYETFLAEYDPKLRELRGVYYTPEPVVSYIVRSVDAVLQRDFNIADGLADRSKVRYERGGKTEESHRVLVLDPAVGTGTFLFSVINRIYKKFQNQRGMWDRYVAEHLLPRIFGFELLFAPYAVAHLKLGLLLKETGYEFGSDERLGVYLTNTLDEVFRLRDVSGMESRIYDEATAAKHVKDESPVMVVLGNPPYSGHSANSGEWMNKLLRGIDSHSDQKTGNYFEVDGRALGERNPKWLNDDYVKFIRFAQWRIEQTGYGVLAFITNHGYLDNPTFRGMRQSLMRTFDEIYVLDLHGNSKKKEKTPEGAPDKNVFDIQQGVAIGIFVKKNVEIGASSSESRLQAAKGEEEGLLKQGLKTSRVFHAHLYGSQREVFEKNINGEKELSGGKYKYLWDNDITTTEWTELEPQTPYYLFSPQNIDLLKEFENGWSVTKAFPVNVLGFQTHRDDFAIAFDKETIKSRIQDLRDSNLTDQQIYERYKIANRDWKLAQARNELRSSANWEDALIKCSYRPFDERFCYFDSSVMDCPRRELLDHVAGKENLCFGLGRQGIAVNDPEWHLISISRHPIDANVFRRGGINLFPLYLYPTERTSLFDEGIVGRRPNFAPEFIAEFSTKLGLTFSDKGQVTGDEKTFTPEDVFYYAYAVFHSPEYRRRYAEFLKINFPRLPLTSDKELFRKLAALGERLTLLHLMEANMEPITGYPERGSDEVEFIKYEAASGSDSSPTVKEGSGDGALADARATDTGRVWINKEQYFSDVPEDVWNFHIGGYQVCQKWLKDRKGRTLSYDDLDHYQKIVASLKETIALMSRIDAAIERRGGYPFKQNRGRAD